MGGGGFQKMGSQDRDPILFAFFCLFLPYVMGTKVFGKSFLPRLCMFKMCSTLSP